MPKVTLGLQPVTISLPIEDETKQENHEAKGKRRKILFWCVPSTSARVVAYQVRLTLSNDLPYSSVS